VLTKLTLANVFETTVVKAGSVNVLVPLSVTLLVLATWPAEDRP